MHWVFLSILFQSHSVVGLHLTTNKLFCLNFFWKESKISVSRFFCQITVTLWFCRSIKVYLGSPGGTSSKEPICQFRRYKRCGFDPGSERSPGGGHGNPLQCSCLKNPMNRGAWWATVYGVAKSQTQLKQLSMHTKVYLHLVLYFSKGNLSVFLTEALSEMNATKDLQLISFNSVALVKGEYWCNFFLNLQCILI